MVDTHSKINVATIKVDNLNGNYRSTSWEGHC